MTNQDNTIFEEVEESLRQDRYLAFFRKYGLLIAAGVVAVLLGILGVRAFQSWQVNSARQHADTFAAAEQLLAKGDSKGASAAFDQLSKTGPQTYRVMAMMDRAATLEVQGDMQGALAQFDAAAAAAQDHTLRDSARLRAAYLAAETQDFQAVRARLQPLIDAGGPISYMAKELLGVEAWEAGDTALARSTLENLQLAFDAPDPVRQRAQLVLNVMGPAPEQPAAPATPAQAPPAPRPGDTK